MTLQLEPLRQAIAAWLEADTPYKRRMADRTVMALVDTPLIKSLLDSLDDALNLVVETTSRPAPPDDDSDNRMDWPGR